jgi:stage IV sporulation protein FB
VLHEFGHCFMSRWLGGRGDDVLLWPLGGLASADPPHRPLPVFLTVAAGPAVNLLICVGCAIAIRVLTATFWIRLNPFNAFPMGPQAWNTAVPYIAWVYGISYALLLFNLLPIFPLDGGQMVQAALWPIVGYVRSMVIATTTGMVGSVALGLFGIMQHVNLFLIMLAACLFYACYQQRQALRDSGEEDWSTGSTYSPSFYIPQDTPRRKRVNRRAIKRARKIARQEAAEREKIDAILAKVSAHGMHSLNWLERRTLRKATERQRKHANEMSRYF